MSSKETLAAQWTTWVRLPFRRSSSAASIPNPGRSTSPSTKRNFRAARPATSILFSSCAPRSRAETTPHDLLRLAVADRLRADHRDDLLDVRVAGGLREDLLAQEAGRPGEQHPQPGALPQGGELRPRLLLQVQDPGLQLLLAQVRRLAELVDVVARGHAQQPLDRPAVLGVAGQLPHRPAHARSERLDQPEAPPHESLVPGHAGRGGWPGTGRRSRPGGGRGARAPGGRPGRSGRRAARRWRVRP